MQANESKFNIETLMNNIRLYENDSVQHLLTLDNCDENWAQALLR